MAKNPSMAHKHSNSVLLSPGESAELIWKFSNSVDIEAACNVPGHYDVGMIAKIDNTKDLNFLKYYYLLSPVLFHLK